MLQDTIETSIATKRLQPFPKYGQASRVNIVRLCCHSLTNVMIILLNYKKKDYLCFAQFSSAWNVSIVTERNIFQSTDE
jgi:hypothetical protein